MGKKIVKIGEKTYVVDSDSKSVEEVEADETPVEETPAEETPAEVKPTEETPVEAPADENLDEKVDDAAQKIMKSLGVDKLREQVKDLTKTVQDSKKESKISALIDLEKMMKKDISEMTAKEKIVGFFQGMIQNNHQVMKALFSDSVLAFIAKFKLGELLGSPIFIKEKGNQQASLRLNGD